MHGREERCADPQDKKVLGRLEKAPRYEVHTGVRRVHEPLTR
jgi:hypothetical protein